MKDIIEFFLTEEKKNRGLETSVDKSEVAKVMGAYLEVEHLYPEKEQVHVLRLCCQTYVDAKVKQVPATIALLISKHNHSTVDFIDAPISKTGRK